MNLKPLLDRTGTTKAWADRQTGWVCDLEGKVFALVVFDGVFDRTGAQIGWWHGDYIQDRHGHVVLSRPSTKIENLSTPQPKKIPRPPNLHLPWAHPSLRWLLMPPPARALLWASMDQILDHPLAEGVVLASPLIARTGN